MSATPSAPPAPADTKATAGDLRATAALAGMFVLAIGIAVLLAKPSLDSGLQQFDDPDDPVNVLVYIGLILVFTFLLLWLAKRGAKWVIRLVILGAVASSVFFVGLPLMYQVAGIPFDLAGILALLLGIATAIALYYHPEWYVIDTVGIIVAAGAASIFGISFGIVPVFLLLIGLAVYDAIAVYKTRHMLALADSVIELRLPILLVVPKHRGYHFRDEATKFKDAKPETKGERDAMFMGLGDLVMPTILVVSALTFIPLAGGDEAPVRGDWQALGLEGDLPLNVTVLEEGPVDGGYRMLFGFALDDGSGGAGWRWTADWDHDDDVDLRGTGVPGQFEAVYDKTGYYHVHVNVTGPDGRSAERTVEVAMNGAPGPWYEPLALLLRHPAALGAALGTLAGYAVLMRFVLKGNPQAGLPLLNGGSLVGFLAGLYVQTGSLRFW